jgi:hypothetical protein
MYGIDVLEMNSASKSPSRRRGGMDGEGDAVDVAGAETEAVPL